MIRLEVKGYCESCDDFCPDVTKLVICKTDTIVRCKNAKRCEAIKRYLERQTKGEASD